MRPKKAQKYRAEMMAEWDFYLLFWGLTKYILDQLKITLIVTFVNLGFPTPAAYAAYTGRGYSSYPGFGLASGIAGYPAGKFTCCMDLHTVLLDLVNYFLILQRYKY